MRTGWGQASSTLGPAGACQALVGQRQGRLRAMAGLPAPQVAVWVHLEVGQGCRGRTWVDSAFPNPGTSARRQPRGMVATSLQGAPWPGMRWVLFPPPLSPGVTFGGTNSMDTELQRSAGSWTGIGQRAVTPGFCQRHQPASPALPEPAPTDQPDRVAPGTGDPSMVGSPCPGHGLRAAAPQEHQGPTSAKGAQRPSAPQASDHRTRLYMQTVRVGRRFS